MGWLPIAFGFPAILVGLLALPVIWWLLRFTPPKPQTEVFPPLRILARVLRKEETPQQSPWWLTLLRLLMAALVIMALAEPVWNPRERLPADGSALAIVMDNGWSSANDWDRRVATAERLINDAENTSKLIVLAFTAEPPNSQIGPFNVGDARERLNAVQPRPVPVDREAVYSSVAIALRSLPDATIAVLTDGLATPEDDEAFTRLLSGKPRNLIWIQPDGLATVALTNTENQVDRLAITAVRIDDNLLTPRFLSAGAFDERGRRIGDAAITFRPGQAVATGDIVVPFELRNDFASVSIDGEAQAGAVRVLDSTQRRRRVGLLSQTPVDDARLLLSSLYYIRRALQPFADLAEPSSPDMREAIPELLAQKPAVIVMGDVGTVPDSMRQPLIDWMNDGGTLIRFASSNLFAAADDTELLPVKLRTGERLLGGNLSWTVPQAIADFPAVGPFTGLAPPVDVTVTRQVLAEPTPDLIDKTWANLADGTPLVTGDRRGRGMVVLFHTTPQATWSNLPISGTFVEMLRRIVQLSRNQGVQTGAQSMANAALPPYRMISATGELLPPDAEAHPLEPSETAPPVTRENPPGLYGGEEGVYALNLLRPDATLSLIVPPETSLPITSERYAEDESLNLKGIALLAAILFFLIDLIIMLRLRGLLSFQRRGRVAAAAVLLLTITIFAGLPTGALAQTAPPAAEGQTDDSSAIDAISVTHLAYVLTGNSSVDAVSRAGLIGLTRFLIEKTALEPGIPLGVDISRDELAFFPLLYYPIDANAPQPSSETIARLDAYMKEGGTVLFDTRDEYSTNLDGSSSPANQKLRDIIGDLNIPPLEPVPDDHVLTKSFFILKDFPGRYSGSPLWVASSLDAVSDGTRPVRTGDGVSPILITGNDLAAAWAVDQNGEPMFPTVPGDFMQRVYAYRAGVNIVMYMLTGNYKSDQVHVKDLLERLGQ